MIFESYWGSPLVQFSKFNNFLWVCWFLSKKLSNLCHWSWNFITGNAIPQIVLQLSLFEFVEICGTKICSVESYIFALLLDFHKVVDCKIHPQRWLVCWVHHILWFRFWPIWKFQMKIHLWVELAGASLHLAISPMLSIVAV